VDPDPEAWILTKINNYIWFPAFQKGFCTFFVWFLTYYLLKEYFSCKNSTFCDFKSDQDPDPNGSALAPRIQILAGAQLVESIFKKVIHVNFLTTGSGSR
jgi:hypothetical protein